MDTTAKHEEFGENFIPPHLGSEYMDAQSYLAQRPSVKSLGSSRKKAKNEPQHGSNDSDFGMADQKQD